jgi:hypothetical protein
MLLAGLSGLLELRAGASSRRSSLKTPAVAFGVSSVAGAPNELASL